jgi:hypothetical protein
MDKVNDTAPEAEAVLLDIYRRMPLAQKWQRLGEMYRTAKSLHAAGVRLRHPAATDQEVLEDWIAVTLGESALRTIKERSLGGERG